MRLIIHVPHDFELPEAVLPAHYFYYFAQFLWIKNGPKWIITCGNCSGAFESKYQPGKKDPAYLCPYCLTPNKIPTDVPLRTEVD